MKRLAFIVLLALVPAILVLAAGQEAPKPLVIIYSGVSFGKLSPCACSPESDLGGILRRDTALLGLKDKYPNALFLDAGSSLDEPTTQGKVQAEAFLDSLKALGYNAVAIGSRDLAFSRKFLEENSKGMLFVSNLRWKGVKSPLVKPAWNLVADGSSVETIALIHPKDTYTGEQAGIQVEDPIQFLNANAKPGALTIVLCSTSRENARRYLAHPEVEIVLYGYPDADILNTPSYEFKEGKVIAEAGIKGSRLGVLKITTKGGKVLSAENEIVSLDKSYADGQRARPFYDRSEAKIKEMFLASLAGKKAFDPDKSEYMGTQPCAPCHMKSYQAWKTWAHSHAWESLKKVKKNFDPECIQCHVVGFDKPGGFISEEDSPHLLNVGCEACHGPGKAHIAAKGKVKTEPFTLKNCVQCHNKERAPAFKPKEGWKKIKHK